MIVEFGDLLPTIIVSTKEKKFVIYGAQHYKLVEPTCDHTASKKINAINRV